MTACHITVRAGVIDDKTAAIIGSIGLACRMPGESVEVSPAESHDGDFLLQPPKHVGNSLSGSVSGPVVQAGMIQNVTVNYRADPDSPPADKAAATGALGVRVPRTREAVGETLRTRPNIWEYLLYAGELYVGLESLETKRLDYALGHRTNGQVLTGTEAAAYLQASFDELARVSSGVNTWMSRDAQEKAFGLPGVPGTPELIVHIARRLLSTYEALIDWAIDLRSTRPPAKMAKLFEIASLYSRDSIEAFHGFVETLTKEVDEASTLLARQDGSTASITVTYTMDIAPEVIKRFNKEYRRVMRKRW